MHSGAFGWIRNRNEWEKVIRYIEGIRSKPGCGNPRRTGNGRVPTRDATEAACPSHMEDTTRGEGLCAFYSDRRVSPRTSSRLNHARATVQSRFTVAGEIWRTSAVSSMLSPAK